jgi:hypothetical protein
VPVPFRLNWQGSPIAVSVPVATRAITSWLCIVPVRFAATVTPLAQVADTVPETDDAVCVVISHFTSAQLPSGRPAIVEDPHAPLNADAADVDDPDPLELPVEDDPVDPDDDASPEGVVGLRSLVVCSNSQPALSIDASSRLNKDKVFMIGPYSFAHGNTVLASNRVHFLKILRKSTIARKVLQDKGQNAVHERKQVEFE